MLAVKELVVGDLIQLKGGDVIPADSRVRAENYFNNVRQS